MNVAFALQAAWALAVIALILGVFAYAARAFRFGRIVASGGSRLIAPLESAALAPNATVHVVRVAGAYYLLGGGAAGVSLLDRLPAPEIEAYVDAHRTALLAKQATLLRTFANVANPGAARGDRGASAAMAKGSA